jgi:pyruvate dehydrogenase (quinone)
MPNVSERSDTASLKKHLGEIREFDELLNHYVEKGPDLKPIRPEYLAAMLSELASDDAMFFADTGTAWIWLARHIEGGTNRRLFGSFSWASMANAAPNAFGAQLAYRGRHTIALCGDGSFTMLALGDLLTHLQRKTPVVHIVLNNESLDFVNIEQQEAGLFPCRLQESESCVGRRGLAWQKRPSSWMRSSIRLRFRCRPTCPSTPPKGTG